ncbi:MAG: fibronectin type III domain-containing protein, partial [bacterium]|nr:fibronectin type III domain-containing protein [bacterium]
FVIDSSSGQISVAEGATLDYEAADGAYRETETHNGEVIAKFYRGEVHYTVDGHAAVINVNIKVTDLEAGQPGTPGVTRTPSSVPMNPALDVSWTAAAANGTTLSGYEAQYRVKAAQGEEPAAWTAYTGTISATATGVTLPDLEAGATYEVQVRAVTSDEGPGPWSGTGSGRANRPPKRTALGTLNPSWLLEWGGDDSVRTISGNFADDDGDTLTYAASAAYPGVFRVGIEGASSDQMRVHVLNPATARVTYGAHDGFGGYVSEFVDVSGFANLTMSVAENSGAGTAVGDAVTGTPYDDGNDETDDALTYSLTGDAAAAFVIDSASGQISVKQGATIDYETKTSYTGRVNWTVQGQAAYVDLTINVLNMPLLKNLQVTRTRYDAPVEKPSLDISWTALIGPRGSITQYKYEYRKKGDANWTSRTVTAPKAGLTLTGLEPGAIYQVRMQALAGTEAGAWTAIAEARANRPPTGTSLQLADGSFGVGVFVRPTSPIADFFADADDDTLTFSTSSNYRGVAYSYIGIDPDVEGNPVKLWARAINPSTATITYGASDAYGGYASKTWKITGVANPVRSVPENSPAGTAVGAPVVGSSWEGRQVTFTYSLHGEALDFFVIDSATGQISVRQNSPMDYETKSSYTGQVKWTVQGQQAVANLTINVIDLEAGKPDAPTVTRTRFSEQSPPALDVAWTAPDANGTTIDGYKVQYRKQ